MRTRNSAFNKDLLTYQQAKKIIKPGDVVYVFGNNILVKKFPIFGLKGGEYIGVLNSWTPIMILDKDMFKILYKDQIAYFQPYFVKWIKIV